MNTISFRDTGPSGLREHVATVEPDFSGFDSAEDILRDASRWGLVEDLRRLLREEPVDAEAGSKPKIIRDIGYELAGAKNRDFAVDLFIHVTGIAEFGPDSLRDASGGMKAVQKRRFEIRCSSAGFSSRF